MLKRIAFVLVVCAVVGVAYGAAVKIRSFETYSPESLDADAMAILNYASGNDKTIVQIIMSDFTPGATYDLRLTDGVNERLDFDAITTDEHGHATYHNEFSGDVSTFDVELYFSSDSTLRAFGDNPAG